MSEQEVVAIITAGVAFVATVIFVIGPFVRKRLEFWLETQLVELEQQLPENIMALIKEIARIAVIVVEATNLEAESREKLKMAEEIAEQWLLSLGYEVELDRIREAIEYVLFEMKQEGKM